MWPTRQNHEAGRGKLAPKRQSEMETRRFPRLAGPEKLELVLIVGFPNRRPDRSIQCLKCRKHECFEWFLKAVCVCRCVPHHLVSRLRTETNSHRDTHIHICPTDDKPTRLDVVAKANADTVTCWQKGSNLNQTRMSTPNFENGDVMEERVLEVLLRSCRKF